jgi:hypothetical protein
MTHFPTIRSAGALASAIAWSCLLLLPSPSAFALASPTLTGQASTPALAGGSMTDTATLAGGTSPTGTITFQLFVGGCSSGGPIFTSTKPVSGNGTYTSDPFSPLATSTFYSWQASYGGDPNNNPVSTVACDGAESVVVPQYCSPKSCPPPTAACGVGSGNITTTTSTTSCAGTSPSVTVTTVQVIGPATVCTGPGESSSCSVAPGGINFDTKVETVTASAVVIPTLSLWGLGALVAGLGALALRRLCAR